MKILKINHGAVWVSVIFSFVLGYLWYGPILGDPWMNMVGLDMATIEANPPGAGVWITQIVSSAIQMYVLAWLLSKMNIDSGVKGAMIGLLIGFAFNHMAGMSSGMYAQEPYALSWINGGFTMIFLGVSGFIMGAWTKYV
jgi:hypothetical protein